MKSPPFERKSELLIKFRGADADAFGRALDASWPGPRPDTVVVVPGEEIVYRHRGELDFDALRGFLAGKPGGFYDQACIGAVR